MTVLRSIGPNARESADAARWSPITKSSPSGTTQMRRLVVGRRRLEVVECTARRAGVPSTKTAPSLISIVSPARPITRLMNGVLGPPWTQASGGSKTTMSPRE